MVNNIKVIINLPRFIIHLFLFTVFYDQCIDDLLRECKNPPPPTNSKYIGGSCI